jgi:two-component system cell cycle response regulator
MRLSEGLGGSAASPTQNLDATSVAGQLNSKELSPKTDLCSVTRKLEEELRRAHEGLIYQASHDPLTGLWNRAGILDLLRREVARSDRQHMPFGVIVFAVDNFKNINETHSEMVGDSVLRAVARRILPVIRPYDLVGRTSGNQFLMVAPGCDSVGATSMAERIRRLFDEEATDVTSEISEQVTDEPEEQRIPVTLSLGVFATEDADDPDRLLKGAKQTLYVAKKAGGNRVVMAKQPAGSKAALAESLAGKRGN